MFDISLVKLEDIDFKGLEALIYSDDDIKEVFAPIYSSRLVLSESFYIYKDSNLAGFISFSLIREDTIGIDVGVLKDFRGDRISLIAVRKLLQLLGKENISNYLIEIETNNPNIELEAFELNEGINSKLVYSKKKPIL